MRSKQRIVAITFDHRVEKEGQYKFRLCRLCPFVHQMQLEVEVSPVYCVL